MRYAEKRRDDFVNGGSIIPSEYSNFVNARNVQRYFLNLIEEVRRSVGNITFLRRDLMHVVPMGIFNKVYLSNILDWRESYSDEEEVDLFNKLIRRMPFGGMICISGIGRPLPFESDRLILNFEVPIELREDKKYDFGYRFYIVEPK